MSRRAERVSERIRSELMSLLLRGDLRDPGLSDCFVSAVRLSDDLRHGRVYVRLMKENPSEREQRQVVDALNRSTGFIRRALSPHLQLKYQPELRFYWDDTIDHAQRIEQLLAEIEREGDA